MLKAPGVDSDNEAAYQAYINENPEFLMSFLYLDST